MHVDDLGYCCSHQPLNKTHQGEQKNKLPHADFLHDVCGGI